MIGRARVSSGVSGPTTSLTFRTHIVALSMASHLGHQSTRLPSQAVWTWVLYGWQDL